MKRYTMFMTFKNQNGMALITALLILLALSAMGTVATFTTVTDLQISGNVRDIKQAFYLAEAGISHAGDFLDQATAGEWASYATFQTLIADTTLGGNGNYTVTVKDAGGNLRRVVSTGSTNTGGYTQIEAIFGSLPWSSTDAILTGGDLDISGNPTVSGACGRVHANNNLTIPGSPTIQLTATASQTASTVGTPTIYGVLLNTIELKDQYSSDSSNKPEETIPEVIPTNFYDLNSMSFDYTLECTGPNAGKFVDNFGVPFAPFGGWEFGGDKWEIGGDSADNLNVKVDCDVIIGGSPGSGHDGDDDDDVASPWSSTMYVDGNFIMSGIPVMEQATIITTGDATISGGLIGPSSEGGTATTTVIADGNIEISGDFDIQAPATGSYFESLLFIAGRDLKINGNPGQYFEGILAVHEQIGISGDPTLNGLIYAEDAENISTLVNINAIWGNMDITYNCGLRYLGFKGFGTTLSVVSWRQL